MANTYAAGREASNLDEGDAVGDPARRAHATARRGDGLAVASLPLAVNPARGSQKRNPAKGGAPLQLKR